MKKNKPTVIHWHIGRAYKCPNPNPRHRMYFSGSGIQLLAGKTLRWWSITVRIFHGEKVANVSLRPNEKIAPGDVFDLVILAIKDEFTDHEIETASDIDALLVCRPT